MLGSGFSSATRSFLTSLVSSHETAQLYTIFSVVAALGVLLGSRLLPLALAYGIELGGWMIGLPFFTMALMYAVCTVLVLSIPFERRHDEGTEIADASDD